MNMPPSSSMSRAVNSFAKQAESYAPSVETAKQAFRSKLATIANLSFTEKQCLQCIAESIFDGDLAALQVAVSELGKHPRRTQVTDVLVHELRCPGMTILPLQQAKWRFDNCDDSVEISIFSLQLIRARRILALADDRRFGAHVYGPEREDEQAISGQLHEDPRILLKQIGRIANFGSTPAPPPFYTGK